MIKINLEDLIGKILFDGCEFIKIVGKYYDQVLVDIMEYDGGNDDYIVVSRKHLKTKSEIEDACRQDVFWGKTVRLYL